MTWGQASDKIPSSSCPLTQNAAHEFGLVRAVQELGRWATRTKSHGSHSVSESGVTSNPAQRKLAMVGGAGLESAVQDGGRPTNEPLRSQ